MPTWIDRVRRGAYTSPQGTRLLFDFEDLSREFDKRTAVFDFPGVNESYVQQNGFSSRRYPLRCIFSGPQCDAIATAFEALLLEEGIGRLEHPLYGTVNVVPFGTITRRDDLKTAGNQSVVEVTFFTTLLAIYPSAASAPYNEILAAITGFNAAAAQQYADSTSFPDAVTKANLKASVEKLLQTVSAALTGISDGVATVNQTFRDIQSIVNYGLDVLIGQPLQLAQQISNLIQAPARALTGIESRLEAYDDLATRIFGSSAAKPSETLGSETGLINRRNRIANDFHLSDHAAMSALTGSIIAATAPPIGNPQGPGARPSGTASNSRAPGAQFTTKPQALEAAESILNQFDTLVTWRDSGFSALQGIGGVDNFQVDTGEAYQALQHAVALATGFLIQTSFSLVPERAIVLDRARTIVDLSAELYGSVDDKLDFLINTNNLTGDEILEIPKGRRIVYYP